MMIRITRWWSTYYNTWMWIFTCSAHTYNLVASKDAGAALNNPIFKSAYRKIIAKAQSLWNAQNRSTLAADTIQEELGCRLKTPNDTRWNSEYDAFVRLQEIGQKKKAALHRVMMKLKIAAFTDADFNFLQEYLQVHSFLDASSHVCIPFFLSGRWSQSTSKTRNKAFRCQM